MSVLAFAYFGSGDGGAGSSLVKEGVHQCIPVI